jgi:type I restriction enzyme S subunit
MKLMPLKDVVEIHYGEGLKSDFRDDSYPYPVYGANGVVGRYKEYIVDHESVVIGRKGSCGEIALAMPNFWPIDTAFYTKIKKRSKLNNHYLYYALKAVDLRKLIITTSIPGINRDALYNVKIFLPDKPTQEKIVNIFRKVESALEKRRQTLRLADQFLKSAFLEMFGEPGQNSKGFKTKSIKDLVKKILNEDPKRYPDKGYSYVDISSVDNQLKKITETKQIFGSDAPSRARQLLQAQDILVSTVRPNLNAVGVLPDGLSNPIGSTGFCVLRANRELTRSEYLFETCKTPFFIKSLVNVAKGASYPAVSDNDILRLSIPVPSLPEQQKFAGLVQKVEKLKEKQKQSETQIQNLFNSLMQRAFKGEI